MLMYVSRVVFRGIVAQVFLSRLIVKFEVFQRFAVKKPEVLHRHCVGALAFDGIVDNANGGSVVYVNRRQWLWVSEFGKSETEDLGFLCIEKRAPNLASAADAATSLSIVHVMWMVQLSLIGSPSTGRLPRKK
jgi:hypothetical protein